MEELLVTSWERRRDEGVPWLGTGIALPLRQELRPPRGQEALRLFSGGGSDLVASCLLQISISRWPIKALTRPHDTFQFSTEGPEGGTG